MKDKSTGRRPRRLVKAGIAVSVAVAAGGALFASQAGAAQVSSKNIMIKVPKNTHCAYVYVIDKNFSSHGFKKVNYKAAHWTPQHWNSIGLRATVGDRVRLYPSTTCSQSGIQYRVELPVDSGSYKNAWVNALTLPHLNA
jgi:hypothetical protein